jgi:transcriptional regulator with XRE-family HTH domain
MEHGKRRVKGEELAKLADLYGVSETSLLGKGSTGARDSRAELAAQELVHLSDQALDRLEAAMRIVRKRRGASLNLPT